LDPEQRGNAILENLVFGHVSPEQTAEIVRTLRDQGQAVAVVGDAVNDVPGMRQANLSIARHSSSQAALSLADIILLEDSPKALLDVLKKGQRIANGLLDVLKLYLVQMLYLTLLILLIWTVAQGFPYVSKQGTILSVVTVSIPAAALSLWAAPGMLPTRKLTRILARFVGPAALTIGVAGLLVYLVFLERTGDRAYAQLGVIYALVGMGLLLVLFVRPPSRLWVGATSLSGDRRFTAVVAVLLVVFLLLAWLPLAYQFFLLEPLQQPLDYGIVGLAVLGWAIILRLVWWLIPLLPTPRRLGPRRTGV
jgi:cation-transporting ATPase E